MIQDERISMLENPEWREWTVDDCRAWLEGETKKAYDRYMMGREEYGPSFVGDPIEHLKNELRDATFYAWQIYNQREALIEGLVQANAENQKLRDENERFRTMLADAETPTRPPGPEGPAP